MLKYSFIILISLSTFLNSAFSQALDDVIRGINIKYSKIENVFSYDVSSKNKSLIADTVKYFYSSHILCNRNNQHDSISEYICKTNKGIVLFAFLNNEILKNDTVRQVVESKVVESPYTVLKRGEMKWSTFTPFIFKKPVIDDTKWNDDISNYSISKTGDTTILEMCNTYDNEPKFHHDDPLIGSTIVKIKINSLDSLIYSYEQILNISKKPDITTYHFSNYEFDVNPRTFDSIKHATLNYLVQFPKEVDVNFRELRDKYIIDLKQNFSDTFYMHDLKNEEDSVRIIDLDSRYLIIDFWFCGCYPCIQASKVLKNMIKTSLPADIRVIGINFLDRSPLKIHQYIDHDNLGYDQFYLTSRNEIRFFDWYGAPTTVVYDRQKREVVDYFEGFNLFENKLMNIVKSIVKE